MSDRLKPWQVIPNVKCERCDEQATVRVTASNLVPMEPVNDGVLAVTMEDDLLACPPVLTCSVHASEVADEVCDKHGGASSNPIRSSWRFWLTCQCPGLRFIGKLEARRWNRRFERNVDAAMERMRREATGE